MSGRTGRDQFYPTATQVLAKMKMSPVWHPPTHKTMVGLVMSVKNWEVPGTSKTL